MERCVVGEDGFFAMPLRPINGNRGRCVGRNGRACVGGDLKRECLIAVLFPA